MLINNYSQNWMYQVNDCVKEGEEREDGLDLN